MRWSGFAGGTGTRTRIGKRGSVGLFLMAASLVAFLLLPLVTGLTRAAYSHLMVLRAGALLDETLPSASLCLDLEKLAEGQLAIDSQAVSSLIHSRLLATTPAILNGRLEIVSVAVSWQSIPFDEKHWLGSRQPRQIPIVTCTIRVLTLMGDPVLLTRSVQLLQTPG